MKWMDKPIDHTRDPQPYDGPIERADGRRPFNGYLWPTESWWAYHALGHLAVRGRFNFGIVALADGRWATNGFIRNIEANSDNPHGLWKKPSRPVVFATREKAIRIAAARFIWLCRHARRWEGVQDRLSEENCRRAINWALGIANRPAVEFAPIIPSAPKPAMTGMPLFDHGAPA